MPDRQTIYAPATAPGRAAIAILRISGPRAADVCRAVTGLPPPLPRRATRRKLRHAGGGETVDDALILWFPADASPTGEDALELHHHGGMAVVSALLDGLATLPYARPADAGEFTRRGFLNGRLDLTAAEGLADLVDATSRAQARQALRQLDGDLGRLCEDWRSGLLDVLARLEAEIDFGADEGVPEDLLAACLPDLRAIRAAMTRQLADGRRGERLREGFVVAVVGPPNAGKSSLVNRLAGRDVAIVTAIPGTTRDVIEVALELEGLPITLLDTAGLRETTDPIEAEGVARARRRAATADLRVVLVDASAPLPPEDGPDNGFADNAIVAWNKWDLAPAAVPPPAAIPLSCVTGEGIDMLLAAVAAALRPLAADGGAPALTRQRHRLALADALSALERCLGDAGHVELALSAEEIRLASRAVGRITGRVDVDQVLDRIFAAFCIGK